MVLLVTFPLKLTAVSPHPPSPVSPKWPQLGGIMERCLLPAKNGCCGTKSMATEPRHTAAAVAAAS